jgi:membrane protein required for colicin V production
MLTGFDYALLAILAVSALRGLWRGLLAEVLGLVGWIAAALIALHYVGRVAPLIPANWPGGALTQWLVAFALLVVAVMLVVAVFNALLARVTAATGLRGVDRSLGMMFGLLRGVILVLLVVMFARFTELPKQDFWRDSLLRPYAEQGLRAVKPLLPAALAPYMRDPDEARPAVNGSSTL